MPFLAGIGGLGVPELLIILVVVLVVFGASRVADIGGSLGKAIREFRKEVRDEDAPAPPPAVAPPPAATTPPPAAASADTVACPKCGTANAPAAKFCAECGSSLRATVG